MSENDVIEALAALGFTINESRAYSTLLTSGASTGYEVHQRAGVPRSAVYGALRRLVAQGAARSVAGSPERFVAVAPDELIRLLRKRYEAQEEGLERAIATLEVEPDTPEAFTVEGYVRILEEAERVVRNAEDTLVVSGWPRELSRLRTELSKASKRGVYTVLFSHAALPSDLAGLHFSYGKHEEDLEDFWRHRLTLVADDRQTLVGATEQLPTDAAVLSETPAIAEVVTSQVALDITLLAQREGHDVEKVMARILGDRVGRLDTLEGRGEGAVVGKRRRGPSKKKSRRAQSVDEVTR
jgi:sugar-specific transcriptional regulator TrmB